MNAKRQRFVQEYTLDHNATQAAIRAGYSAKTARAIGSELLTFPDVHEAIVQREADIANELGITKQRLLKAQWDVYEKAMAGSPKVNANGELVTVTEHYGHTAGEDCGEDCRTTALYEWNAAGANQALQTLMRHRGMLVDRQEQKVEGQMVHYTVSGADLDRL
ncbi:MAG TPA: terminase small subunit [Streptosporangiaceae bacterium]